MNLHFDEMISSPSRLAIMAALVPGLPVRFSELKDVTGLSDGNLHVQTHKLADAGYLRIRKTRRGRRTLTEFSLTALGLDRFRLYVRKLQRVLERHAGAARQASPSGRRDDSAVWS